VSIVGFSGFADLRIPYGLSAATNLVLTASIGQSTFLIVDSRSR
jgi:hypothetical protein